MSTQVMTGTKMNTKAIGGILLIVGTAIGGGMLALPIAAAELGFARSSLLLFISWLIMTSSAFVLLEVNLWLPPESNLISMAQSTLGRFGRYATWFMYLLLFYSLVAAYIAGGSDFFHSLFGFAGIHIPAWLTALIFTGILSSIVYQGIRTVDYTNRVLMFSKLGILVFLLAMILSYINPVNLSGGQLTSLTISFTVMLTSFGYANVIPSLRTYFKDDVKKLRRIVLIGSIIPLVCYIFWDLAIMGVIPRGGSTGLISILHSGHSTSDLANIISSTLNLERVTAFTRAFTSICLATSFLGVSLALFDFFADGLKVKRTTPGNIFLYLLTFAPPLAVVLFYPGIFIKALSYAGVDCLILLVFIPALMAWVGRYRQKIKSDYQVPGGKLLLIALMVAAVGVVAATLFENL